MRESFGQRSPDGRGEAELIESLEEIEAKWLEKAESVEPLEVGLEKADIRIDEVAVLWIGVE